MTDAQILAQALTPALLTGILTTITFTLDGTAIDADSELEFRMSYVRGGKSFFVANTTDTSPNLVRSGTSYILTIPKADSADFNSGTAYFVLSLEDDVDGDKALASGTLSISRWSQT